MEERQCGNRIVVDIINLHSILATLAITGETIPSTHAESV